MIREETAVDLIGRIYDASENPLHWQPFLTRLADVLQCRIAAIDFYDFANHRGGAGAAIGMTDEAKRAYIDYFAAKNVLWLRAAADDFVAPGTLVENRMLFHDAEFAKTEYCNDFLSKLGVFHVIGSSIIKDNEVSSNLSLLRGRSLPFEEEERRLLRTLLPHLRRGLSIHRRLAAAQFAATTAAETIDQLPGATIVVDDRGQIGLMNRAAMKIVEQRDGLRSEKGQVAASVPSENRHLQSLIARAALTTRGEGTHAGGIMTITRSAGKRPLIVMITPVSRTSDDALEPRGTAAIFIADPDATPRPSADLLRQVHGLTPAEARLATHLLGGLSVVEAAQRCAITLSTARTHLKHILTKTNTRRQSELLLLLSAAPQVSSAYDS